MTTPNQDAFPIQFPRHFGILASPRRVITESRVTLEAATLGAVRLEAAAALEIVRAEKEAEIDDLCAVRVQALAEQKADADREIVEIQAKAECSVAAARVEADFADAHSVGAFDERLKAIMEDGC